MAGARERATYKYLVSTSQSHSLYTHQHTSATSSSSINSSSINQHILCQWRPVIPLWIIRQSSPSSTAIQFWSLCRIPNGKKVLVSVRDLQTFVFQHAMVGEVDRRISDFSGVRLLLFRRIPLLISCRNILTSFKSSPVATPSLWASYRSSLFCKFPHRFYFSAFWRCFEVNPSSRSLMFDGHFSYIFPL